MASLLKIYKVLNTPETITQLKNKIKKGWEDHVFK